MSSTENAFGGGPGLYPTQNPYGFYAGAPDFCPTQNPYEFYVGTPDI